jgi:hypothetical protein
MEQARNLDVDMADMMSDEHQSSPNVVMEDLDEEMSGMT